MVEDGLSMVLGARGFEASGSQYTPGIVGFRV